MIKLEKTSVMNLENAIRGARNPMNSWARSDSHRAETRDAFGNDYVLGPNDLDLAMRLRTSGTDHRKFLRQIFVTVDITAPLYWWKEADTYKVATVANSCSTMHKIQAKAFTPADFSIEHLSTKAMKAMQTVIDQLNESRDLFNATKDKAHWWDMIQLLPTSYNQMRTWTCNYETLNGIYRSRKDHKLDEWHAFCDWIRTLPYAKELIIGEENW